MHINIYLAKTNQEVCPVQAIARYLTIRGRKKWALFITSDGSMLTRNMFASALTKILYKLDLNARLYNTHSFCIDAATSANEAGIRDLHIKTLGRWRSDTDLR